MKIVIIFIFLMSVMSCSDEISDYYSEDDERGDLCTMLSNDSSRSWVVCDELSSTKFRYLGAEWTFYVNGIYQFNISDTLFFPEDLSLYRIYYYKMPNFIYLPSSIGFYEFDNNEERIDNIILTILTVFYMEHPYFDRYYPSFYSTEECTLERGYFDVDGFNFIDGEIILDSNGLYLGKFERINTEFDSIGNKSRTIGYTGSNDMINSYFTYSKDTLFISNDSLKLVLVPKED